MEIPHSTYLFNNVNYTLEQILNFYYTNRIDTDLDCQRGYVWTDAQKQQLIDTLMNRERIPEFHVIKEVDESIYHFADGKQRITTIINFLTNKLEWERAQANKIFYELFGNKGRIKFEQLPNNFQNMILNTQISFACYNNMTPKSITKLFRKLNNGSQLGEFQKGLAENIVIKKNFLNRLMEHEVVDRIYNKTRIEKGSAEQNFVRMMVLMSNGDEHPDDLACDLRPPSLPRYYVDLETATAEESINFINKLEKYQTIILKYLNILNTVSDNEFDLYSTADYVPLFSIVLAYQNNLDEATFKALYSELLKVKASTILGVGADFNKSKVKQYFNYINQNILFTNENN